MVKTYTKYDKVKAETANKAEVKATVKANKVEVKI